MEEQEVTYMGRRYIGGSKARSSDVFNYLLPEEDINPSLIYNENYSDKLLRQEYTRLRDIAQKRMKRMIGKPEALETVNQLQGGFPTIKQLKQSATSPDDLRQKLVYQLQQEKRFLTAKRGSLSGIRNVNKQTIESLQKRGIPVKKEDLYEYGKFMEMMRKAYGIRGRKKGIKEEWSDLVADMWKNLNEKGQITEKDFKEAYKEIMKIMADEDPEAAIRMKKAGRGIHGSDFFKDEKLSARTRNAKKRRQGRK